VATAGRRLFRSGYDERPAAARHGRAAGVAIDDYSTCPTSAGDCCTVPVAPMAAPDRKHPPYGCSTEPPRAVWSLAWGNTVSAGDSSGVAGGGVVTFRDVVQAAVLAGSAGVRVTFMPGLSRSSSRILERVWRAGFARLQ
jgi:hypothetical protein